MDAMMAVQEFARDGTIGTPYSVILASPELFVPVLRCLYSSLWIP
jgi:hypothetical protein